ncbi:MAG: ATP-binding cassette domain-containing protein [Gemmatimonadota bacterium]|nr:ATP-binding cassette domain-containing protein [Gemmatimonadota bacterium]
MAYALVVENLWKSYTAGVRGCSARVWALRSCSLHVALGERVAIVGSPGAGKTTLLQCIAGTRRADAGQISAALPMRCGTLGEWCEQDSRTFAPSLLLLDGVEAGAIRYFRQGSLVVTSRDVASVHGHVDRVLLLRDGRLATLTRTAVRRVAEPRPAAPDGSHVR